MTQERSTLTICPTSICSAEGSPARAFQMPANASDLKMQEVLSSLNWPAWLKEEGRLIFSLRTSPDCYRMTKAGRILPSSPRLMTWGIASNGLCLTASILTFLNQESGCSLSAILIEDAPEKYYLSSAQTAKLLYKSSAARKDRASTTPRG